MSCLSLRACAECTVPEPFLFIRENRGGGGCASEACEKAVIFVFERIFLHFSIKARLCKYNCLKLKISPHGISHAFCNTPMRSYFRLCTTFNPPPIP